MARKYLIETFGCQMNVHDSERMAGRLEQAGFEATDEAVEELAAAGFDPLFGARPLRRVIQDRVDNAIADALLRGQLGRRDKLIYEKGGTLRVEKAVGL